jgi:hypothetical protein
VFLSACHHSLGARCSVFEALCYEMKVAASSPDKVIAVSNLPNSNSRTMVLLLTNRTNRNEYQVSFWGVRSGRRVKLTTSLPTASRLSVKYGILDASQAYEPPRPTPGIRLLFFFFTFYTIIRCVICSLATLRDTPFMQTVILPSDPS